MKVRFTAPFDWKPAGDRRNYVIHFKPNGGDDGRGLGRDLRRDDRVREPRRQIEVAAVAGPAGGPLEIAYVLTATYSPPPAASGLRVPGAAG